MTTCPFCKTELSDAAGMTHVCTLGSPMDPNDVHDATVLYRTDQGVFCRVETHAILLPGDKLYLRKNR